MNYYISDLHLGHANIIRLCNRPYSSIEEMDSDLIYRWNSTVNHDDDVYILGDLIYKSDNPEEYLKQLIGKLHLIKGNHDTFLKNPVYRKYFESIDAYKEISDNGRRVVLFHYPMVEWNGFFRNSIHLYGHIHNSINATSEIMSKIPNCYNVGADLLGFTPKTLSEIIGGDNNKG